MSVYRTGLRVRAKKKLTYSVSAIFADIPINRLSTVSRKAKEDGLSEIVVSLSGRAANTQAVGGGQHSLSDG